MSEYETMVRRQRKWMFYLLAIFVLGTGFTSYTEMFNGLILGTAISFYNLWLLQRKIDAFGQSVVDTGSAKSGLGVFSRLAAAAVGVLIALRFPDVFHMLGVIIGLLTSYIIILFDMFIEIIKNNSKPNRS